MKRIESIKMKRFIQFVVFFLVGNSALATELSNSFLNDNDDYWVAVPEDYSNTSISSCQAILSNIANPKKYMIVVFVQYNKSYLKAVTVVPSESPARSISSTYSHILAMDHRTYIKDYINVVEKGNNLTITYRSKSQSAITDSYIYDKNKNLRYYVAMKPVDAILQLDINEAKKRGLPGSKEVKCKGPL
jgi:hypothetical protein